MQGWMGKTLEVDLSSGEPTFQQLGLDLARLFLGGRGLGARLLWDRVEPEVDPLSPDNALIFCTAPLTATAFQTSNRFDERRLQELVVPCPATGASTAIDATHR